MCYEECVFGFWRLFSLRRFGWCTMKILFLGLKICVFYENIYIWCVMKICFGLETVFLANICDISCVMKIFLLFLGVVFSMVTCMMCCERYIFTKTCILCAMIIFFCFGWRLFFYEHLCDEPWRFFWFWKLFTKDCMMCHQDCFFRFWKLFFNENIYGVPCKYTYIYIYTWFFLTFGWVFIHLLSLSHVLNKLIMKICFGVWRHRSPQVTACVHFEEIDGV